MTTYVIVQAEVTALVEQIEVAIAEQRHYWFNNIPGNSRF
jgi:hypothetical protein